jgi:hypothetical protein
MDKKRCTLYDYHHRRNMETMSSSLSRVSALKLEWVRKEAASVRGFGRQGIGPGIWNPGKMGSRTRSSRHGSEFMVDLA